MREPLRWIPVMLLFALVSSTPARAESPIEQRIQVQQVGEKIVAFRGDAADVAVELQLREEVLWLDSSGKLGAVLTDRRFLVVSDTSPGWIERDLRLMEPTRPQVAISSNIVLAATGDRIIGFDALTSSFLEWSHGIDEPVLALEAEREVAAAVLASRVLGYTPGGGEFIEERLHLHEEFRSLRLSTNLATVQTSQRVLALDAAAGRWSEERLPVGDR